MIRFGEGRFKGRDIIDKPSCPFCGQGIERPEEATGPARGEMPAGTCACGAAYTCDVTGHNLGTALVETLVLACGEDWDKAWSLLPEEDYLERQVRNYDLETHLIIHGGIYQGRRIAGTLLFIKLLKAGSEAPATVKSSRKGDPLAQDILHSRSSKALTKKDVESLVAAYDLYPILDAAREDTKILRDLKRLLYSGDKIVRWRAAEAIGKASALIAQDDHGTVVRLLQGFLSSLTDTASSSWGALDAIGEIIGNQPERFSGYIPQLILLSRDRALLAGVLRALGRIGDAGPDLLRKISCPVIPLLQDPDPEIRGYTAILLGNLKVHEAKEDLARAREDKAEIELYRSGMVERKTVGQIVSEALGKL